MAKNLVTREQLESYRIPEAGIQYVLETCDSPPSRKVGAKRRRNLILEVPMQSISAVLQAESLSGEHSFLLELDRDKDLIAAFDQPTSIRVEITDRRGRHNRTTYTADYLVVFKDRVCAYEIKADHELAKLLTDRQEDWIKDPDGYHYLPARKHYKALGIEHRVLPTSTFSAIRADNLLLLNNARHAPDTRRYRKMRTGLLQLLRDEETMLLSDILERVGDMDATPVLQLVDSGELFADLDGTSLSDPSSVWISIDPILVAIARRADVNLRSILETSCLINADVVDPRYELEVATRLLLAQGLSNTNRHGQKVSDRTIRRHKSALRKAQGDPISLQPNWGNCGNREMRIGVVHKSYLQEYIHKCKGDSSDPSVSQSYQLYLNEFHEVRQALDFFDDRPVSRSSFYNLWNSIQHRTADSYCKGGRRLENAEADAIDPNLKSLVVSRPFSVAHVDHYKCDFFLVACIVNGKPCVARPWLTAMVDAFSGEVLAIWLSFADPSKKACTMVMRDCVRRHGRLPEMIIVDAGSDFRSVHFQVMLATLGVTRCERPPEDPRFGQEAERLFGLFKERFARGLPGFGISIEKSRAVSASFKSEKKATLSLLDAIGVLDAYVFLGYNHSPKPGSNNSRYALKEQALRHYPHCGRKVDWDLRFLIATSIEAPGEEYKLWPGRGLHVDEKWYTSPRLSAYRGYKKDLIVRLEPYADSVIYVCIEGKWIVCLHSSAKLQFATSERSLLIASAERSDLRALRKELENEMNRAAASIVNRELEKIATREESKPPAHQDGKTSPDSDAQSQMIPNLNFDSIEPYENEPD